MDKQGEPGHVSDGGDHWVTEKHPFELGVDNRCTECGQPESNAGHPPLPEEAPRLSLDEQMSEAIGSMQRVRTAVMLKSRDGWVRNDWVREAEEIMDDIDGSAASLLNGHVMALLEELHDLRRRNLSMTALRSVDLRTLLQVTPVVAAAQELIAARRVFDHKSVERLNQLTNATEMLETTVDAYNAILVAEDAKEKQGEKND